jgi:hypothetical protein
VACRSQLIQLSRTDKSQREVSCAERLKAVVEHGKY